MTASTKKRNEKPSGDNTPMEVDGNGSIVDSKKEQDIAVVQEIREQLRQIEKSVSSKESR